MNCPCGNELTYENCCKLIHDSPKKCPTAENLMRARYSAFAKGNIDFIGATHIPGTEDFNAAEAKEWADSSTWDGLQIVKTQQGLENHSTGTVEFKASYHDQEDKKYVHHELAQFKKENDTWFYADGQIVGNAPLTRTGPKIGRNDPCTCGSGKKFKKCCGQ